MRKSPSTAKGSNSTRIRGCSSNGTLLARCLPSIRNTRSTSISLSESWYENNSRRTDSKLTTNQMFKYRCSYLRKVGVNIAVKDDLINYPPIVRFASFTRHGRSTLWRSKETTGMFWKSSRASVSTGRWGSLAWFHSQLRLPCLKPRLSWSSAETCFILTLNSGAAVT